MTTAGTPTAGMPTPGAAPLRRAASLLGLLARWNNARLTRQALRRLSRHQLGDLGIDDPETLIGR